MPTLGLVILGILAAFPASDLAIALINRVVTDWLGPRTLPIRLGQNGVPEDTDAGGRPTYLTRPAEVEELVSRLEIHYLANPDGMSAFRAPLRLG